MTDRHIGYLVVLDKAVRTDDEAHLADVISRMRGVASVKPIPQDVVSEVAMERALAQLRRQLVDVLYPQATT